MVLRCLHGETSRPQTHFAGSSEAPGCCPASIGLVTAQGACPQRDQTDGSCPTALGLSARTAWLPQPQISSAHWAALGSLFSPGFPAGCSCSSWMSQSWQPSPNPPSLLAAPVPGSSPSSQLTGRHRPAPSKGTPCASSTSGAGGQTQRPGGTRVAWGQDGAPGTGRRAQAAQTCNPGLRTNSWRLNSRWDGGKRGQILIYSLFRDRPQKRRETPQTHT